MKNNVSILIIDVRSRDDFKEGHIMSPTSGKVICVEPSILEREDISADQISQSMVLAPAEEQEHFESRDTYDLVVFYDESSLEVPSPTDKGNGRVLSSLHRALVKYNYGKELKHPPKILKGGLEAWVDLMGPGSLKSTADSGSKPRPGQPSRSVTIERRRSRYVVKQLKPDDVKEWQATIQKDVQDTAASPNFVRTREEFLRRYPSISSEQQSMTAPVVPRPRYGSSHKNDLESELPSPPSRPAPARPRQSYSGLAQSPDESDVYEGTIAQKLSGPQGKSTSQVVPADTSKHYTGLTNPQNWCYANGLLQSLLASPGFGREIANSEWIQEYRVPRKGDEPIDHPQLMTRIVSNLYHWMSSGKFEVMKAQTLMVSPRLVNVTEADLLTTQIGL
jgi:ubiquitin carboxyl-terminal hydrolase 8